MYKIIEIPEMQVIINTEGGFDKFTAQPASSFQWRQSLIPIGVVVVVVFILWKTSMQKKENAIIKSSSKNRDD